MGRDVVLAAERDLAHGRDDELLQGHHTARKRGRLQTSHGYCSRRASHEAVEGLAREIARLSGKRGLEGYDAAQAGRQGEAPEAPRRRRRADLSSIDREVANAVDAGARA